MKIGIIGLGNMGTAIARRLQGKDIELVGLGRTPTNAPAPAARAGSASSAAPLSISMAKSYSDLLACDWVLLCVKPKDMGAACDGMRSALEKSSAARAPHFTSIAAGVPISFLRARLGVPAARAMPNLCAAIGQSNTAISFPSEWNEQARQSALSLLARLGRVQQIPEPQMAAWTAAHGSGPAFMALALEETTRILRQSGMSEPEALEGALYTMASTAQLLQQSHERPEAFIGRVTSPGGTTEAGLKAGDEAGRTAFALMLGSAAKKAQELEQARA